MTVADQPQYSIDDVRRILGHMERDDPDRLVITWHLANMLSEAGTADEDVVALAASVEVAEGVIAELGVDAPERAGLLSDMAITLWAWWELTGDEPVLAYYLATLRSALEIADVPTLGESTIDTGTLASDIRINLGSGLMTRFDLFGDTSDRREAMRLWSEALVDPNLTDEERATVEADISVALGRGDALDGNVERAVEFARRAVADGDPESSDHGRRLILLGNSLVTLHSVSRALADLDEGIGHLEEGLLLLGSGHRDHAGYAANLMLAYRAHYFQTSHLPDLEKAAKLATDTVTALKVGSPDRCHVFTCSGTVLRELAVQTGKPEGLDAARDCYQKAIEDAVPGSEPQTIAIIDLVTTLRDIAEADATSRRESLDEAVAVAEQGLTKVSEGGDLRASILSAAANAYRDRFWCFGDRDDLEKAAGLAQQAVDMTGQRDPDRARRLTNLAVLMSDRYEEYLSLDDLDVAIDLYEQALAEDDLTYGRVEERESNLAQALRDRFGETGDLSDLGYSIRLGKRILARVTPASPSLPDFATTVANALAERFGATRRLADLDEALRFYHMAVDSPAANTAAWSGYAMNLGMALAQRAVVGDDAAMMDEATTWLTKAIDQTPTDVRDRAMRLSNAADVWRMRAEAGLDDHPTNSLNRAIDLGWAALELVKEDDSDRLQVMSNLALAIRLKAAADDNRKLTDQARMLQRETVAAPVARAHERFDQATRWAYWAQADGLDEEAMEAYSQVVGLVSTTIWRGLSIPERLALLADVSTTVGDAVACAARTGHVDQALAWADKAKSIVWAQLSATPDDAEQAGLTPQERNAILSEVFDGSLRVLRAPEDRDAGTALADSSGTDIRPTSGHILARHRAARALDRDAAPETLDLSTYTALAPNGWIATLAHSTAVDEMIAILVGPTGGRDVIPLKVDAAMIQSWVDSYHTAQTQAITSPLAARRAFLDLLESLWRHVAAPLLQQIDTVQHRTVEAPVNLSTLPRLWWQAVGDLAELPWHAAGVYPRNARQAENWPEETAQDNVPSHVIPSYVRRVADLARPDLAAHTRPRLLLVAVDRPDGNKEPTPGDDSTMIGAEASIVQEASGLPITTLAGAEAHVSTVLDALPSHQLFHLAAHGHREQDRPFESGVNLADGVLALSTLAGLQLPEARLAIVLACDTATEADIVPDEALHLVGALEAAGFRSVVGAVMPVAGTAAIKVAERLHHELASENLDTIERVPVVLHDAIDTIRHSNPDNMANPFYWAPIAHFQA